MSELEDKSVEELERMLDELASGQVKPPEQEVSESVPVPEPEEVPSTPEPEAAKPEEKKELEFDAEDLKLQLEEFAARAKHWESIAGKNAGEVGFLRQKIRELESGLKAKQPQEEFSSELETEPRPVEPATDKSIDRFSKLSSWAVSDAIGKAGANFLQTNPDALEMQDQLRQYLEPRINEVRDMFSANDPAEVYKETTRLFNEAYWHAKAESLALARKQAKERRAEQFSKLKESKQAASVSGTGAIPAPPPKVKTLDEMTVQELDRRLRQLTE